MTGTNRTTATRTTTTTTNGSHSTLYMNWTGIPIWMMTIVPTITTTITTTRTMRMMIMMMVGSDTATIDHHCRQ